MITSNMSLCKVAAAARKDVGQVHRHAAEKHGDLALICRKGPNHSEVVRVGAFTSQKHLQWVYVITAVQGRITLYPLLWYVTSDGVHALQLDAEGPASYFQPHVVDRYILRYCKKDDLPTALRIFHRRNYDKACHPDTYKGDRDNYAAVLEDGYVAGEYLKKDAIVHYRTFYDMVAGHERFGHLRPLLEWRDRMTSVVFDHTGRRETPHVAWCRGYPMRLEQMVKAA